MVIQATGNPAIDFQNIQNAVNGAANPIYLQGHFNLGNNTVVITRSVTIEGQPYSQPGGQPVHPRITGGGAWLDSQSILGHMHSGAFRVTNPSTEPSPVAIRKLTFTQWRGSAITADACMGLEVSECNFYDPVPGSSENFKNTNGGALQFTSAIFAAGSNCTGRLRAEGNKCDFTQPKYGPPLLLTEDEQFLACVETNFNSVHAISNKIATRDDGVEVILGADHTNPSIAFPCATLIEHNTVTIKRTVPQYAWLGHGAILCCNNRSGTTEILNNKVYAYGGDAVALALSGAHFNVRQNTVTLGPLNGGTPYAAFSLGAETIPPPLPLDNLGPSLNDSEFYLNTVLGGALYGFATFEQTAGNNQSSGNVLEDNHFEGFTASPSGGTLCLTEGAKHNRFIGNFPGAKVGGGWVPANDNLVIPA